MCDTLALDGGLVDDVCGLILVCKYNNVSNLQREVLVIGKRGVCKDH
jgi:hypothetical protein